MTSQPSLTIASLLKRPTHPVFLLGAGCSVRSGIPASEALVAQIGKWGYCVAHARDMDDPTVVRSDWWPWLTRLPWFRHDTSLADQYPTAVEAILRPREDRKAFFRRILNPGLPASRGYQVLAAKVVAYCEAVRLPIPAMASDESLIATMAERNLAVRSSEQWTPSKGGQLLFARTTTLQISAARINVEIYGDPAWAAGILEQGDSTSSVNEATTSIHVGGNLWVQLEAVLTLLARANRPFRLKGHASRDIYPYPPLALKEIATNLLAHRDYRQETPSRIRITENQILFENPGGLTDHVRQQLQNRDMESVIRASARGIKGYRNPVIADFFFSAGAMDKEGSGLPDVVTEAANNLNSVTFGPVADNTAFRVEISVRPEALTVDPTTRTARASRRELRYSPNLLSISTWPDSVWSIPIAGTLGDSKTLRESGAPPFCRIGNDLWTFADPASERCIAFLQLASGAPVHSHPTTELLRAQTAYTAVPWLLNLALEQRLDRLGLRHRFLGSSIRAYYPADNDLPRAIGYRGLFKQTKRTVTKPIVSRNTGKVFHWEHKAVALRFERFAETWALSLLPTYVFTTDGVDNWIPSQQIGPKTTRRTARDYNPTVLHNLVFWSRILAATMESRFELSLDGVAPVTDASASARIEMASLIPIAAFEEQADSSRTLAVDEAFEGLSDDDLDVEADLADEESEEGFQDVS